MHKPKGVRFGPTIVYDAERCIVCTRCIRVCDEVVGDHVLDMRERGNRNEIIVSPGRQLDHKYTLMTEHVCPVGALTSRDFRFKARVWFLKSVEGVCTGCATGCNTHVDYDPRATARSIGCARATTRRRESVLDVRRRHDDLHPGPRRGSPSHEPTDRGGVRTATCRCSRRTRSTSASPRSLDKLRDTDPGKLGRRALARSTAPKTTSVLAKLRRAALGADKLYLAARDAELIGWDGDDILRQRGSTNPNRAGAIAGGWRHSLDETLAGAREPTYRRARSRPSCSHSAGQQRRETLEERSQALRLSSTRRHLA